MNVLERFKLKSYNYNFLWDVEELSFLILFSYVYLELCVAPFKILRLHITKTYKT